MTVWEALVLGVVQGLTEFLPVSSSGHLVVASHLFGLTGAENPGLLFDVTVHVGTLAAVFVAYGKDLWQVIRASVCAVPHLVRGRFKEAFASPYARLGAMIVLGTIPTGLMGILLKDTFESLFDSPRAVGFAFLVTGTFLWFAGRRLALRGHPGPGAMAAGGEATRPVRTTGGMRVWDALTVGIAQGLAITPGISRSGSTIAAGLFLGLERELAARFSFLLAVPAILGAVVLELRHGLPAATLSPTPFLVGFAAAGVSGYLALRFLLRLLVGGRLGAFAWYLWPLGLAVLAASFLG